ncbi:MAG: hypothetical protein KDC52_16055, partial [Ignavibacteriae bacterium]|nr:hypothetical protein [Ignavibacteriota bacterium]
DRLQKEATVLTTALAEVIRSLEMADISLRDVQPMFMQIDESLPPINGSESSLIKNILSGLFIGFFISIAFIFLKGIYKEALN